MEGDIPSLRLCGLDHCPLDAPLPLKRCFLQGTLVNLFARLSFSYTFEASEQDPVVKIPKESTFRISVPDFCSVTSFEVLVDDEPVSAQLVDSNTQEAKSHQTFAYGDASSPCVAVISNLCRENRVELKISLLTELSYCDSQFLLSIPTVLIPHLIAEQNSSPQIWTPTNQGKKCCPNFQLHFEVQTPSIVQFVDSPTHPVIYTQLPSDHSTQNGAIKAGVVTFDPKQSVDCMPSSMDHLVLSFALNDYDIPPSTKSPAEFPRAIVERRGGAKNAFTSTLLFRPSLMLAAAPTELMFIVDAFMLPMQVVADALKTALKNELANGSRLFFNVALILPGFSDAKFALPRTSLATTDALNKVYQFLDALDQQTSSTSQKASFSKALHSILARPTPGTDLQRRAILISNMHPSRKHSSVEQILAITEDFTLMPIGIGPNANFSVLHSLAQATHGRADVSWDPSDIDTKIALQIQRSRQPKIHTPRITFSKNPSFWTPQPLPSYFIGDLIRAFAVFNNVPTNTPAITAQLIPDQGMNFESSSTTLPIDFSSATDESNTATLLSCVERVFDMEDQLVDAQDVMDFVQEFSVLTARTSFFGEKTLTNKCHVTLFTIPEWEGGSGSSGSGSARKTSKVTDSRASVDATGKMMYDFSLLTSMRSFNERPLDLPMIPGVTMETPVSVLHSSSSPLKSSGKRRSSHNQQHHTPQKPKRPVLTIQGVWSDSKVDAAATKSPQHYIAWFKTSNSWLNKITKDNYDRLATKLLTEVQTELDDPYSVKGFTSLIYDKAIRQTTYSAMYADLVRHLIDHTSQQTDLIRRSLLDKCRFEFELALVPKELLSSPTPATLDSTPPVSPSSESSAASTLVEASEPRRPRFFNSKLMSGSMPNLPVSPALSSSPSKSDAARLSAYSEDEEEKENKARAFRTGLVTFLGKLYKKGIVNVDITQSCIGELLSTAIQLQEKYPVKSTECLTLAVQYIRTVGKYLHQANKDVVEKLFQYIDMEIMDSPSIDSRARILFGNLIELKDNDWVPRERQSGTVPQTLADIRKSVGTSRR